MKIAVPTREGRVDDHFGHSPDVIEEKGRRAKDRIRTAYSWEYISDRYAEVFLR